MPTIREKVLAQKVKHGLDDRVIKRISKRLEQLKAESPWGVTYRWDKKRQRLFVQTAMLHWETIFKPQKVEVYVEGPSFLRPILAPAKRMTVAVLKAELDALNV